MSSKINTDDEHNPAQEDQNGPKVIDIGVNLTSKAFGSHWREVSRRAIDVGVEKLILTGTSMQTSRTSLEMAQQWFEEMNQQNLYCTIGVHPHDAKHWTDDVGSEMLDMLGHPLAVAVGECGLDYNRNFSSKESQRHAFQQQIKIAIKLNMPMFLHEREAHEDFIEILDNELAILQEAEGENASLPPIVVHCFTGSREEAMTYISRGYCIGFTGTICKQQRGESLREMLPDLPLNKLMVETDAPFMGFKKGRRRSEPADCIDVARKLSDTMDMPFDSVCEVTYDNTVKFFNISD